MLRSTDPPAVNRAQAAGSAPAGFEPGRSAVLWALLVAVPIAFGLPVLARAYLSVTGYWIDLVVTTGILLAFAAALAQIDAAGRAVLRVVASYRIPVLAAVFLAVAVAITFLVFDNVPHVSDEVAYQFQARALVAGRLAVEAPAEPEFFDFVHTMVDDGRWYGIMNPGWPALLALGHAAGVPWLVNPLLGAATLLVFFAFFRRVGYEPLEARLAVLLMAVSPFLLFMAGTMMAHPANLLLFGVFLWACAAALESGRVHHAALAGLALAVNLLVRPIDAATAALPFVLYAAYRAVRRPRLLAPLAIAGVVAAAGIAVTLLYNEALTGDPRLMPMTKYFFERNPGERFGIGFGADMGTSIHGAEWPGYYPLDAVRVTAYRLAQLLLDVHALPLLLAAALIYPLFRRSQLRDPWHALLLGSAACLIGVYILHFYHGIAYGSRHYFLALPAIAVALARPLAGWLRGDDPAAARRARLALAAGLLFAVTVPYLRLLPEYADRYRQASGLVRDAVAERGLSRALVFVAPDHWAWKSAFPLNEYPLEENDVLFARDRGAQNARLLSRFPGRAAYRLRLTSPHTAEITPLEPPPGAP